ncbi:MAG: hypothetical protein LBE78_08800 [Burkholderiaceae bacterium]|jgi:hypothetical protein|nr:hypothetical protein [Burkholderiaceae bacterium]
MTGWHQPSGLARGLNLLIDPGWSPQQAMAVIELLDDLRDRIWAHYEIALLDQYRQQRITEFPCVPRPGANPSEPF